jgi:hypothetical protein
MIIKEKASSFTQKPVQPDVPLKPATLETILSVFRLIIMNFRECRCTGKAKFKEKNMIFHSLLADEDKSVIEALSGDLKKFMEKSTMVFTELLL